MLTVYFDLETTSKWANTANILEFGYILVDPQKDITPIAMGDMFFYPENEVPASASAINGLNKTKLGFLSGGKQFYQQAELVRKILTENNPVLAGYNSKAYDLPILQRHFADSGVPMIPENQKHIDFCRVIKSFKLGTTDAKLGTLFKWVTAQLGTTEHELQELYVGWCYNCGIPNPNTTAHGALYDSFMTYIVYTYLIGNGYTC